MNVGAVANFVINICILYQMNNPLNDSHNLNINVFFFNFITRIEFEYSNLVVVVT